MASVLRGNPLPYPTDADRYLGRDLLELSAIHGVKALLYHGLKGREEGNTWPCALRDRFRGAARYAAARELLVRQDVVKILQHLAAAEVNVLLLKGTPLAYGLYPQPYLRKRGDTDLLVPAAGRRLSDEVLCQAGYVARESAGGSLASSQASYSRRDGFGVMHVIDLHWRLSNAQVFARSFGFDELLQSAVPIPSLGPAAMTPCAVHALMIACLHRTAHLSFPYFVGGVRYVEANRLVWLYDIHLLAGRLSRDEWSRFVELAAAKGLRAVCLEGLRSAQLHLHTSLPEEVAARLSAPGPQELSDRYLRAGALRRHLIDLRALPGWPDRLRLLGEWAFPPAEHVLRKYRKSSRSLLPWLYLRRAVDGVARRWS